MPAALLLGLSLLASPASSTADLSPCVRRANVPLRPIIKETESGRRLMDGQLRGALRDGQWVFYWPSGFKKEETTYCEGTPHGKATFWYENGVPALEGWLDHGQPRGRWTYWTRQGLRNVFTPQHARSEDRFFVDEGSRALGAGNLDLAEVLLSIGLRRAGTDPMLHRSIGVLYAKKKDGAKAAHHYRRYIELKPTAPDRAQVERMLRRYENLKSDQATPAPAPIAAPPQPARDQPKVTVRLEIITVPEANVVIDGRVYPRRTPLTGTGALRLTPGRHTIRLELSTRPVTIQPFDVIVTEDRADNRVQFIAGERLETSGAVKVLPPSG